MQKIGDLNVRSLIILFSSILLFSCAGMRRMQEDMANGREKDKKAFVEKKDGEIIEASEARYRSPLFGKSTIEINGDIKIPLKDVAAYQDDYAYYHTTPDGFAPRIKKGLINMYRATEVYTQYEAPSMSNSGLGRTSTRRRYIYYLQKGQGGVISSFTPGVVESYVNDYAPAMEFINDYNTTQQKVKIWSIINTTAFFGGLVLAGAAGIDKNDKITAAGVGGLGLFVGGLVNGFVNKIRKGKNYKNLELAIDSYNGQVNKKKRQ